MKPRALLFGTTMVLATAVVNLSDHDGRRPWLRRPFDMQPRRTTGIPVNRRTSPEIVAERPGLILSSMMVRERCQGRL